MILNNIFIWYIIRPSNLKNNYYFSRSVSSDLNEILNVFISGCFFLLYYKDDLSHHKSAAQTPIYSGESVPLYQTSNAVDRNPTTCMRTDHIGPNSPYKTFWWKVDLGGVDRIYRIYRINILFKLYAGYCNPIPAGIHTANCIAYL